MKRRFSLISLLLVAVISTHLANAYATVSSRFVAPGPLPITTGTFILFPANTSSATNTQSALALLNSVSKQFFYVKNGGTFTTTAFTLTLSAGSPATNFALTRCDLNVSFIANNTCATGTQTVVYANTTAPVSTLITLNIPVGSWYHFQETPSKKMVPTVSVAISSNQIVNTGVTNS